MSYKATATRRNEELMELAIATAESCGWTTAGSNGFWDSLYAELRGPETEESWGDRLEMRVSEHEQPAGGGFSVGRQERWGTSDIRLTLDCFDHIVTAAFSYQVLKNHPELTAGLKATVEKYNKLLAKRHLASQHRRETLRRKLVKRREQSKFKQAAEERRVLAAFAESYPDKFERIKDIRKTIMIIRAGETGNRRKHLLHKAQKALRKVLYFLPPDVGEVVHDIALYRMENAG